jgi:PIN domain nuclease of toxin-antitoxin system
MTGYVYDSSALLAIILGEPGADIANANIANAMVSSVNLAEVFSRAEDKGIPVSKTERFLIGKEVQFVDFDADLARIVGTMRAKTRSRGLSIGDRACIALASRERATVVTADRIWAGLDLPCKVELIR